MFRQKSLDVVEIVEAIRTIVPGPAEHHRSTVGELEARHVTEYLRAGIEWYKPLNDLERALEKVCLVKRAVCTVNGTAALHVALMLAGVQAGDEVLIPSLTFVAVANAVTYVGAIPRLMDSMLVDFGMNPFKLAKFFERETKRVDGKTVHCKTGRRIAAIVPVHLLGHPCQIDRINAIAAEHDVTVIEDAFEALGSAVTSGLMNRPCGSLGKIGVLSFNLNKVVTGGGGGAIVTDSDALANAAYKMITTARVPHKWLVAHDQLSWNYRMPALNAAVALTQLNRLSSFMEAKRALAKAYAGTIRDIDSVKFHVEPIDTVSNYWLSTIMIDSRYMSGRDLVMEELHRHGLKARAVFTPMHKLPMFEKCDNDNPLVAEDIFNRAICLPSGVDLGTKLL